MDLTYSEEQDEFRAAVRAFCAATSREDDVRRLMASGEGFDRAVWRRMGEELGLCGLTVPEALGGSGFGAVELALVLEEQGRALLASPYLATEALAVPLLRELDAHDLLARVASGAVVAVAVLGDPASWDAPGAGMRLQDGRLTGRATYVVDAAAADVLLAVTEDGRVAAVEGADITAEPVQTMDLTRRLAEVPFDGTPAVALGDAAAVGHALDVAAVALAAEQLGAATHLLELTAQYAKDRMQFGRPIGSFQAVKHRLADVLIELELARSAVRYAAWAADHEPDDLPLASSLAFVRCSEAAFRAAAEAIQLHGGIAFTWEHQAHLFFKRIKGSHALLRPVAFHRARLADLVAPL